MSNGLAPSAGPRSAIRAVGAFELELTNTRNREKTPRSNRSFFPSDLALGASSATLAQTILAHVIPRATQIS